jgi:3-methyladenine DNA glycosylase/8-oxoguanine DNA glycosylase
MPMGMSRGRRVDVIADLAAVRRAVDGATRLEPDRTTLWWATHTPAGPATLRIRRRTGRYEFAGWGPGQDWIVAQGPAVVGSLDDADAFRPVDGPVRDLLRRHGPVVFGRTDRVFDACIAAVFGQKVQTVLAGRSVSQLTAALGETAPGPVALRLRPRPEVIVAAGSAALHRFGVERKRGDTLVRAAREASRLERAGTDGPDALDRRLLTVRGIGAWTSAVVRRTALGDPDAVPVGDAHIPHTVCWALAGEPRGDDARMLELLEPYRPHRGRVVALLEATVRAAPRFGPRLECLPLDRFDRPGARLRDRGPRPYDAR